MPRTSVPEVLYGRGGELKIFVSSKMRQRAFGRARKAAVEAIESLEGYKAWCWERDSHAGPYSSEAVCLGQAGASDGLVLLLGDELTGITEQEYRVAKDHGVPCYIMVKSGAKPDGNVKQFVRQEREASVTSRYRNLSELRTTVTGALLEFGRRAHREKMLATRRKYARRSRPTGFTGAFGPGFGGGK